jgi:hypothetical protein
MAICTVEIQEETVKISDLKLKTLFLFINFCCCLMRKKTWIAIYPWNICPFAETVRVTRYSAYDLFRKTTAPGSESSVERKALVFLFFFCFFNLKFNSNDLPAMETKEFVQFKK